jgi:hypothetical protein
MSLRTQIHIKIIFSNYLGGNIMVKCKECKGTNFGLTVVETKVTGYRAIDGAVTEQFGEPKVTNETKITYCFGCNKPITEADTYTKETCKVCNTQVDELIDGKCKPCDDKVKKLAKMTKEELIIMMMQGVSPMAVAEAEKQPVAEKVTKKATQPKVEEKVEPKKEVAPTPAPQPTVAPTPVPTVANTVVKEAPPITPVISKEEENASLKVDEDLNSDIFGSAVEVSSNATTIQSIVGDEVDILAEIEKSVDLASLNIINEDITQPI